MSHNLTALCSRTNVYEVIISGVVGASVCAPAGPVALAMFPICALNSTVSIIASSLLKNAFGIEHNGIAKLATKSFAILAGSLVAGALFVPISLEVALVAAGVIATACLVAAVFAALAPSCFRSGGRSSSFSLHSYGAGIPHQPLVPNVSLNVVVDQNHSRGFFDRSFAGGLFNRRDVAVNASNPRGVPSRGVVSPHNQPHNGVPSRGVDVRTLSNPSAPAAIPPRNQQGVPSRSVPDPTQAGRPAPTVVSSRSPQGAPARNAADPLAPINQRPVGSRH